MLKCAAFANSKLVEKVNLFNIIFYGSFDDKLNSNIVYPRLEIIQSHANISKLKDIGEIKGLRGY